jgi:hypothetical protein
MTRKKKKERKGEKDFLNIKLVLGDFFLIAR